MLLAVVEMIIDQEGGDSFERNGTIYSNEIEKKEMGWVYKLIPAKVLWLELE